MSAEMQNFAAEMRRLWEQGIQALQAAQRVGPVSIGATPKEEVFRHDKVVLYRYRAPAAASATLSTPLLICYALINRPYMMDLQPDRSLIAALLAKGIDVYLIDWGYPDGADRYLDMHDFVNRYLHSCVERVCTHSGSDQVNLLGVCQGGTLSLIYAALHPERVRNLITMVTPVDFRTADNLLTRWTDGIDVDALVDTYGNVPGELLNAAFVSLMPFRLMSQKYMSLIDQADDPAALATFLRMEKWIFDSPDQPGEMFRQFVTWCVKENRLIEGRLTIRGERVDLRRIDMPVLNVYALQDHLVPPSASRPLSRCISSTDYSSYEFPGGHIGIYVSGAAQREVPVRVAQWLRARDPI